MTVATRPSIRLEVLEIPEPCTVDWGTMKRVAGERHSAVRHCELCSFNVYDLRHMPRAEAESLVARHEAAGERLCVRLTKRADGTVVTGDCTTLRQAGRLLLWSGRKLTAMTLALAAGVLAAGCYAMSPFHRPQVADKVRAALWLDELVAWIDPPEPRPNLYRGELRLAGSIAPLPAQPLPPRPDAAKVPGS